MIAPCRLNGVGPRVVAIGLESTGNPVFNRNWTLLHVPCVTIPFGLGPNGMPVGVQFVAQPGEHERLLSAAKWIATRLGV